MPYSYLNGNFLCIGIMSVLFIRWMQKQEAKQLEREAQEYAEADNGAGIVS